MEINIWQILFQALNFGILLFILNKFLYKPILSAIETRAKKISEGLVAADKSLKSAAAAEGEKKEVIAKARKDALQIIKTAEKEAKLKGDTLIDEAKAKAKAESERILKSAESEKLQAMKEVEAQAAKLAIVMAKKALMDVLSAKEVEVITTKLVKKLG